MEYLYKESKEKPDFELVQDVCHFMLNHRVDESKPKNNEWGAIYVEGRDRQIRDVESFCAIKSFKLFSKYNAPVYLFIHNDKNLLFKEYGLLDRWNIKVIKIPLLDNLERYSEFCIKELYNLLPPELENVITIQPDAMLLKPGFEDYILNNDFDWISSHWKHRASIAINIENKWVGLSGFSPTAVGNGGFSYRKASKIRAVSKHFSSYKQMEIGRDDDRPPMEDLFYCYWGFNSRILKTPTLKECDQFAVDPLTRDVWNDKKNWPFGFHYIKEKSEFPPCNHE